MEKLFLLFALGFVFGSAGTWLLTRKHVASIREKEQALSRELAQKSMIQAELECSLKEQKAGYEEKLAMVKEYREGLKSEFQVLAAQILEEKSLAISQLNKENIGNVLTPLREQLVDFRRRVDDVYDKESQGRAALLNEISCLKSLGMKMSQDATNLTRALKGDGKVQGDWGQVILERLLEMAGLEKGREYDVQVNTRDTEGNRFIPDVIVRLPQHRDTIIDSKVSLTAFERYCSAQDEAEKARALKDHLISIRKHVDELSAKDYNTLPGVHSVDCVLMFVPVEAAYLTALKEDPSLFTDAFAKNITVVCPSTLLSTLKIIAYIWRIEKQQRNTQEIAARASDLFDKFCTFAAVFLETGESIKKAQEKFEQSLKALATGKGNLIRRAEAFRALGVGGKKKIPQELLDLDDPEGKNDT